MCNYVFCEKNFPNFYVVRYKIVGGMKYHSWLGVLFFDIHAYHNLCSITM